MWLNCKVIKKVAPPPHFYISPPFEVYPPFLAKGFVPPPLQVTQFLEGPTPYCPVKCECLCKKTKIEKKIEKLTPVKFQINCKIDIFMNLVFSTVAETDFMDICILIFYKPIPLPQINCPTFPPHYLLTVPHQWETVPPWRYIILETLPNLQ